jgi:hypothetical protein
VSIEERLRAAITARTTGIEGSPDALHRIEERLMETERAADRNRWLYALGGAAAAVAVVVGVLAVTGDDDEEPVLTDDTTTTTESTTTTTTTEPTTTSTTTFTAVVDPAVPIFPDPATSRRFDAPEALVQAFVTEMVGMTSPVVGPFQQGDSRSGEVEVRGFPQGAPTVVLVRQLEDDTWFVIGAETDSIRPAQPVSGATVSSPQALTGQAYAFEGTVQVRMLADGASQPVGATFVTGRGDGVLGDYSGQIEFDPAGAQHGVLLYTSEGGEDGSPIAFVAHRVHFG